MKSSSYYLFFSFLTCGALSVLARPNVILIMADDMGYEALSSNGSESCKSPNLDKLAKGGIRFTNCFSNPICTPSRAKIMTGQYNVRNYVKFGMLDRGQTTFAHQLKAAGYATCDRRQVAIGKAEGRAATLSGSSSPASGSIPAADVPRKVEPPSTGASSTRCSNSTGKKRSTQMASMAPKSAPTSFATSSTQTRRSPSSSTTR